MDPGEPPRGRQAPNEAATPAGAGFARDGHGPGEEETIMELVMRREGEFVSYLGPITIRENAGQPKFAAEETRRDIATLLEEVDWEWSEGDQLCVEAEIPPEAADAF